MPAETLHIRPVIVPEDREAIAAIFAEADLHHAARVPYAFREAPNTEDLDEGRLAEGVNRFFLCAEWHGQVVGFVSFHYRESPPYSIFVPHRYLMVENLAVLAAFRRRGIGRMLMHAVADKAHKLGVDDIRLNVWEGNEEARRFYEHIGCETLSRTMILKLAPSGEE